MKLIVIDSQALLVDELVYEKERFISHVKSAIRRFREQGIEVIYIRHDEGADTDLTKGKPGFEIYKEFSPMPHEKIFDKQFNSAFKETGLLKYLQEESVHELVIVGLQTDYCIDATVKCAFDYGFKIYVPDYCHGTVDNAFLTAKESYDYYHQHMWSNRYATCISLEALMEKISDRSK